MMATVVAAILALVLAATQLMMAASASATGECPGPGLALFPLKEERLHSSFFATSLPTAGATATVAPSIPTYLFEVGKFTSVNDFVVTVSGASLPSRAGTGWYHVVIDDAAIPGRLTLTATNGARILVRKSQFGTTRSNSLKLSISAQSGALVVVDDVKVWGDVTVVASAGTVILSRLDARVAHDGQSLPRWDIDSNSLVVLHHSLISCPSGGACEFTWSSRIRSKQVIHRFCAIEIAGNQHHDTTVSAGAHFAGYYCAYPQRSPTRFTSDYCPKSGWAVATPGTCARSCRVEYHCDARKATAAIPDASDPLACECQCSSALFPESTCQLPIEKAAFDCGVLAGQWGDGLTPTDTVTVTPAPTRTSSRTATQPATHTLSASKSLSRSVPPPPTRTSSRTFTPTPSFTRNITASASLDPTASRSANHSESVSAAETATEPLTRSAASASMSFSRMVTASSTIAVPKIDLGGRAPTFGSGRVSQGQAVASSAASVLGAAISPSTATKPTAMQRSVASIATCGSEGYVDDGFPSPFNYVPWRALGGAVGESAKARARASAAGAALFTGVIIAIVTVTVAAISVLRARGCLQRPFWESAAARLSCATLVSFAAAFLLPSVAEAAAFVILAQAELLQLATAWAGVAAASLVVAPVALVTFVPAATNDNGGNARDTAGVTGLLIEMLSELVDGLREPESTLHKAASLIEIMCATAIAALSGVMRARPSLGCAWAPYVIVAIAALLLGYYALMRPFTNRLENGVVLLVTAMQTAVAVLVLVAVHLDDSMADTASSVSEVFEMLSLLAPVVLALDALREVWVRYKKRPGADESESDDGHAETAVGLAGLGGLDGKREADDRHRLLGFDFDVDVSAAMLLAAAPVGVAPHQAQKSGRLARNPLRDPALQGSSGTYSGHSPTMGGNLAALQHALLAAEHGVPQNGGVLVHPR